MKVVITGANGFIGRAMVRFVQDTAPKAEILGLLRDMPADRTALPFRPVTAPEPADLLIDLAGSGGIPESFDDPAGAFETACRRSIRLIDDARQMGIGTVILASTCAVYPFSPDPAPEDGPLDLNSPYAEAKRATEIYGLTASRLTGQDIRIARLANIYGPGQRRQMIYEVAQRARTGGPVTLQSAGQELRDFLHVDDTARAIWTIASAGRPGELYNVGSGEPIRVIDVARRICDAFGAPLTAPEPAISAGAATRDAYPETSKLRGLGFRPILGFEDGLSETLDWIAKNT